MDITQVLVQGVWNASCVVLLTRSCNLLLKRKENQSVQPYVMPKQHPANTPPTRFTAILPATLFTGKADTSVVTVPLSLWLPCETALSRQYRDTHQATQVTGIVIPVEIVQDTSNPASYRTEGTNGPQASWNLDMEAIATEAIAPSSHFRPTPRHYSISPKLQTFEVSPQNQCPYESD